LGHISASVSCENPELRLPPPLGDDPESRGERVCGEPAAGSVARRVVRGADDSR
jgi:hypothetical protein